MSSGLSDALFKEALRQGPWAALLRSSADGRLLEVSNEFELLSGYARHELLGRTARQMSLWAEGGTEAFLWDEARRGHDRPVTVALRARSGRLRTVHCRGVLLGPSREVGLHVFRLMTESAHSALRPVPAVQRPGKEGARAHPSRAREGAGLGFTGGAHPWTGGAPDLAGPLVAPRSGEGGRHDVAVEIGAQLTRREFQVLDLIARGLSNDEIANELQLAAATVRNYITSLYGKIGTGSRAAAIIWARERGIGL